MFKNVIYICTRDESFRLKNIVMKQTEVTYGITEYDFSGDTKNKIFVWYNIHKDSSSQRFISRIQKIPSVWIKWEKRGIWKIKKVFDI